MASARRKKLASNFSLNRAVIGSVVEQLREELRVAETGGRLGVVLGEPERVGEQERVEP